MHLTKLLMWGSIFTSGAHVSQNSNHLRGSNQRALQSSNYIVDRDSNPCAGEQGLKRFCSDEFGDGKTYSSLMSGFMVLGNQGPFCDGTTCSDFSVVTEQNVHNFTLAIQAENWPKPYNTAEKTLADQFMNDSSITCFNSAWLAQANACVSLTSSINSYYAPGTDDDSPSSQPLPKSPYAQWGPMLFVGFILSKMVLKFFALRYNIYKPEDDDQGRLNTEEPLKSEEVLEFFERSDPKEVGDEDSTAVPQVVVDLVFGGIGVFYYMMSQRACERSFAEPGDSSILPLYIMMDAGLGLVIGGLQCFGLKVSRSYHQKFDKKNYESEKGAVIEKIEKLINRSNPSNINEFFHRIVTMSPYESMQSLFGDDLITTEFKAKLNSNQEISSPSMFNGDNVIRAFELLFLIIVSSINATKSDKSVCDASGGLEYIAFGLILINFLLTTCRLPCSSKPKHPQNDRMHRFNIIMKNLPSSPFLNSSIGNVENNSNWPCSNSNNIRPRFAKSAD